MSALRCFLGIPLDRAARRWATTARESVIAEAPAWAHEKWVRDANLHVTVRFLGDVAESDLAQVIESLGYEIEEARRFTLGVESVVAKPNTRRCRMLWAACNDVEGGFTELVDAVERGCMALGIPADPKTQIPHVTLCRARGHRSVAGGALDRVNTGFEHPGPIMSVRSVRLFTSRLAPRGPEYDAIATWRLRGE